ncbi:MAG TPA: 7-cyano-7-deazaguanine synthase [Thermoanaerobaculia bacterium]|nr:7-cyano-7-deazaguanine synthase [Thermoanaerobaculia bacterium]
MRKIVLCLSGGFDSSATAALFHEKYELYPIFFNYNQPSLVGEHTAALRVVRELNLPELTVAALPLWPSQATRQVERHVDYCSHRNLYFGAAACNFADNIGAEAIWFGFVADADERCFPDATLSFAENYSRFLRQIYGSQGTFMIDAPNGKRTKEDLARMIIQTGFRSELTYSCAYAPPRCGACRSCQAVIKAFEAIYSSHDEDFAMRARMRDPYCQTLQPAESGV